MKSLVVVFLLGAAFLSANASILEHIYNNTHLRGNVKLDTNDGLKLGYEGGLFFNNSILGFEIANIGGNIKAVPKYDLVGNSTNGSVDYSGDIQVKGGKHKASIGVDGTAGLYAEWDKQTTNDGGSIGYNASIKNHADWTVDAGENSAAGVAGAILNVSGRACKDGDKIFVKKRFAGAHSVSGSISGGDNDDHTFRVTTYGRGGLKKKIFINSKSDQETEVAGPFPQVAYGGVAGFQKAQYIKWDDTKIQNLGEGGAIFHGLVWAEKGEDNDTWIHNIKHAKNADFGHKGYTIVDDELVLLQGGKGNIAELSSAQLNVSKDKTDLNLGEFYTGDLHHVGVIVPHPEGDKEQILKEMKAVETLNDYDLEGKDFKKMGLDENDKGKGIVTYLHAGWAGGKGVHAQLNDDATVDVDSIGGTVWQASGVDSKEKKPWHKHGAHGYNSSFVVDPNTSSLKNIQVQIEKDPKKVEDIKQRFQGFAPIEPRQQY